MKRYRITSPRHARERWHQHPWVRRDMREIAAGAVVGAAAAIVIGVPLTFVILASSVGRG